MERDELHFFCVHVSTIVPQAQKQQDALYIMWTFKRKCEPWAMEMWTLANKTWTLVTKRWTSASSIMCFPGFMVLRSEFTFSGSQYFVNFKSSLEKFWTNTSIPQLHEQSWPNHSDFLQPFCKGQVLHQWKSSVSRSLQAQSYLSWGAIYH